MSARCGGNPGHEKATTPLERRWAERDDERAARRDVAAPRPERWKGDEAVPSGLAVASAVTLRMLIVVAGIVIVGAFTAGAAAVLVALVANGLPTALVILAVIVAVQQLEGNVFYPIVVGRKLALHPVAILLALTAGGLLAGVAGAFLALPLVAVGAAVLGFMRERREQREAASVLAP